MRTEMEMSTSSRLRVDLSPSRIVRLWMELEDARLGVNSYGGDTAEIYASTVGTHTPAVVLKDFSDEYASEAADNLSIVLSHFCEVRGCDAELLGISGADSDDCQDLVFDGVCPPFEHRVHVRIIPRQGGG